MSSFAMQKAGPYFAFGVLGLGALLAGVAVSCAQHAATTPPPERESSIGTPFVCALPLAVTEIPPVAQHAVSPMRFVTVEHDGHRYVILQPLGERSGHRNTPFIHAPDCQCLSRQTFVE